MNHINTRFGWVVITVLLLLVFPLISCQSQSAPTVPATSAPAAQAPEELKIAWIMGITGPQSVGGTRATRAAQMAVDDWNTKGGLKVGGKVYRPAVVVVDDKATSEGGLAAFNRAALAEKTKFILGGTNAGVIAPGQSVAEGAGAMIVAFGSIAPDNLGPKHPTTTVAGNAHPYARIAAIQRWLVKNHPQAKRLGMFATDDANGKSEATLAEASAKTLGLTLVTEYFPPDTKDFNMPLVRLLANKIDAIQVIGSATASPVMFQGIAKALAELNWKGPFIGAYANQDIPKAGPIVEGYVFPILADRNSPVLPPVARDTASRYVQKYGEAEFDQSALSPYNTVNVLFQGIEKAGTVDDVDKVAGTLRGGQWETLYGKAGFGGTKTFGLNSVLEVPIVMGKVEGGKMVNFEIQPGTIP